MIYRYQKRKVNAKIEHALREKFATEISYRRAVGQFRYLAGFNLYLSDSDESLLGFQPKRDGTNPAWHRRKIQRLMPIYGLCPY